MFRCAGNCRHYEILNMSYGNTESDGLALILPADWLSLSKAEVVTLSGNPIGEKKNPSKIKHSHMM